MSHSARFEREYRGDLRETDEVVKTDESGAPLLQRLASRRFWGAVGAVIGALAALTGIAAFALDRIPDSDEAGCRGRTTASLGKPSVGETSLGDFIERISPPEQSASSFYTAEQLRTQVQYVSVELSAEGQKDKPITLRWSMRDADNPDAVDLPRNRNAITVTPPTCNTHRHPLHVLVDPPVPSARTVWIELVIVDEDGQPLAPGRRTPPVQAVT